MGFRAAPISVSTPTGPLQTRLRGIEDTVNTSGVSRKELLGGGFSKVFSTAQAVAGRPTSSFQNLGQVRAAQARLDKIRKRFQTRIGKIKEENVRQQERAKIIQEQPGRRQTLLNISEFTRTSRQPGSTLLTGR